MSDPRALPDMGGSGSRECAVADVRVGDFVEIPDWDNLYGEVVKIHKLDRTRVGDGQTDWYTFHIREHDREFPHNDLGRARVVVGPKRGTATVVNWS